MERRPPHLIEGADGITDFVSLAVIVRDDNEAAERAHAEIDRIDPQNEEGTDELDDPEAAARYLSLLITQNHERVHFVQLVSSAFLIKLSRTLCYLHGQVAHSAMAGKLTPNSLASARQKYISIWQDAQQPEKDICTTHLMEAAAVTEGFRTVFPGASPDQFDTWLQYAFPERQSVYRLAIDRVANALDLDAAYNLTPKLCFFALEHERPARAFHELLDIAKQKLSVDEASIDALLFRFDRPPLVISPELDPRTTGSPLAEPFLELLASAREPDQPDLVAWLSSPGRQPSTSVKHIASQLMPPFVAGSACARIVGLAQSWDRSRLEVYVKMHAIMCAARRLLTDGRPYQACEHRACPTYSSAMCHGMMPPSLAVSFEECFFHHVFTTSQVQTLMGMREDAGGVD